MEANNDKWMIWPDITWDGQYEDAVELGDNGSTVFYHPDHWEPIDNPDSGCDDLWYNTNTNGKVALRAKTKEASKYLSDYAEFNIAFDVVMEDALRILESYTKGQPN